MEHTDESAITAIKRSRALIAGAALSCVSAFAIAFAALYGSIANVALAVAAMAALIMLALVLGALGASQRSTARMKGWAPAKELNLESIQAKTRYLQASLETEAGFSTPATEHERAGEPPADPLADGKAQAVSPDKEDAPFSGKANDEEEDQKPAAIAPCSDQAEGGAHGGDAEDAPDAPEAFSGIVEQAQALTEEELLIAEAEALLAQAAGASPETQVDDMGEEPPVMLSEDVFRQLAGMGPLMRNDDDEQGSPRSTIRTRRIARERIATVDKMLSNAQDVVAISRDLARSNTQDPAFAALSRMLKGNPILETEGLPQVRSIKLTRNDRYWMGGVAGGVAQDIFDALLSLEAIYNINQDIQTMLGKKPDMEHQTDIRRRIIAVLSETANASLNYTAKVDYLHCAYADADAQDICSDWALRSGIANAAENARLPFRIAFDMATSAKDGLAVVLLEIPRPSCFSFVGRTKEECEAFARDYAIRSAVFMARAAFGTSFGGQLKKVLVRCAPHATKHTLLSLEATPETMPEIKAIAGSLAPLPTPIRHPAIRMEHELCWLDPVEPHQPDDDDLEHLFHLMDFAEMSERECPPALAQATGAKWERDLGTRAEAPLEQVWLELGNLGNTTESAVAAFRILSDEAESQQVREACNRVMVALVDGSAEPSDREALARIFIGKDRLKDALSFGLSAYTSQSAPDMERAIGMLKEQLDLQTSIELIDDTQTAFRYFHGVADRIHYNLTATDPRTVSLVPHSYYTANEMLAYLLCQVGRAEEAEPYAREIRRICPYSPAGATILARVLERQERIMEAIDVVNDALLHAATVHDAALCYYRMAYLQWRCGRDDLANASYRLTVALHSEISKQARQELDELLASNDDLSELTPTSACKKLAEGGVRVWDLEGFRDRMAQAAILCADQQLYPTAAQLTLTLLEFQKDDAITDIFRSFSF